jgi:hypothetical protein
MGKELKGSLKMGWRQGDFAHFSTNCNFVSVVFLKKFHNTKKCIFVSSSIVFWSFQNDSRYIHIHRLGKRAPTRCLISPPPPQQNKNLETANVKSSKENKGGSPLNPVIIFFNFQMLFHWLASREGFNI